MPIKKYWNLSKRIRWERWITKWKCFTSSFYIVMIPSPPPLSKGPTTYHTIGFNCKWDSRSLINSFQLQAGFKEFDQFFSIASGIQGVWSILFNCKRDLRSLINSFQLQVGFKEFDQFFSIASAIQGVLITKNWVQSRKTFLSVFIEEQHLLRWQHWW